MKYLPFAAAFAALIPSLANAQNPQFVDCQTLEAAANFVGPDEALVNGMVCKVVKPKASPSVPAPASEKTAENEKRMALLGVIEPETLRSKAKAEANPPGVVPKPGTTPEPQSQAGPGASAEPQTPSFEMIPEGSLADVARAYRRNSQTRAAMMPEGVALPKKPSSEVQPAATPPAAAPNTARTPAAQPDRSAEVSVAAQASPAEAKPEVGPAAIPAASVIPVAPPPAAKTRVFAVPETPPVVGADTNMPVAVTTPVSTRLPQPDKKTEVFAPAHTPPSQVQPQASPATASAAEDATSPEPQQTTKLGVFVAPQASPSEMNPQPQPVSNGTVQEDVFNEGQQVGCTKNVSLGSLDKERLFLAIPDWAAKWYEKNQKKFPGMCFSDSPMPKIQNYLIVFYTSVPPVSGIDAVTKISASADMSPVSGVGTFTTSYGSTWHYTYDRTVTTTVTTVSAEKVPHNQQSNVLYATAYSEQGIPISQLWPTAAAKRSKETSAMPGKNHDVSLPTFRRMEELLNQMVADIAKM